MNKQKNVVFQSFRQVPQQRRQLPKLMACMTKTSLENLRNKALFNLELLDKKEIRRRKLPLHQCLILEMREAGFCESSDYLRDLIYDNEQILAEDEIGVVVDLKKKESYILDVCRGLQKAEKERGRGNTKEECGELLALALHFAEKEKGILWLAEKLFLASIAVSSKFILDGGRQKAVCKFFYAKFLLDKFPGAEPEEEAFVLLTEVRDAATGKNWKLYERRESDSKYKAVPKDTLFGATALQLHRVLLSKSRLLRKDDIAKSERLARLAERRAGDANKNRKIAEAVIDIGICQLMTNNLNNALKTLQKAFHIFYGECDIEGICITKMHMASVYQKMQKYDLAARMLTEMGALAMKTGLRLQLGYALTLLGELHLRREHPELGTQHLAEAFSCFMGQLSTEHDLCDDEISSLLISGFHTSQLDVLYEAAKKDKTIYIEEAEQSRLMMAVSAGQEIMSSFFGLVKRASNCAVAQLKVTEWKLNGSGWWVNRMHHQLTPCMCPRHNRTPLDVVNFKLQMERTQSIKSVTSNQSVKYHDLGRVITVHDVRSLRTEADKRKTKINVNEIGEAVEEEEWAEMVAADAKVTEQDLRSSEEISEKPLESDPSHANSSFSKKKSKVFIIESDAQFR